MVGTPRSGYGQDRFVGTSRIDDRVFVAGGGVHKLTRTVHLESDVRAGWTRSNLPMNNVLALTGSFGVRVQS
ncbi:outer membrane beta-barrel protein [Bradyrhizobium sp.]|uniref:outer membrane beta-barrel protein n=1 Tax=Bradyrhizobium sp. TaxID=376 RepID=UPI002BF73372|nr:outer membrane beta-barrel protein [Bradyrhizobium sp.]HWX61884.1 outer membrane beta-barrel protein [Bradyrhizobium sp.]